MAPRGSLLAGWSKARYPCHLLSRKLDSARAAYRSGDVEAGRAAHIHASHEAHSRGQHLKSVVYGGLDGIITTFAVVAGVAGASLDATIVLILGFANLVADGLSMAIGDFLSTKAELQLAATERDRESWEVDHFPDQERAELVEVYTAKGMPEADAVEMVAILSRNKNAWIDTMMAAELGIPESNESPLGNGVATFLSFVAFGFVPLVAHVLSRLVPLRVSPFFLAVLLTAITLFILGTVKVRVVQMHWLRAGSEMLLVGGVAAVAAYAIGAMLRAIVSS